MLIRSLAACCVFVLPASLVTADEKRSAVIDIWPAEVPGEKGDIGEEQTAPPEGERPVKRISNVSRPTLTIYHAPPEKDTGAAVVVCPGGGYNILAFDLEGEEVANWLNGIGIAAIVLKYRVPRREGQPKHLAPLQDAQRAISIVRSRAVEHEIDPQRIGILGFSAGGHLSAAASTNFGDRQYEKIDEADEVSCRPDFTVLIYPAYIIEEGEMAPEISVSSETPPAFMVHAGNDRIGPENSIAYYQALHQHQVPAELHIFPTGGHGFGLRPTEDPATHWPKLCQAWLKQQGMLEKK